TTPLLPWAQNLAAARFRPDGRDRARDSAPERGHRMTRMMPPPESPGGGRPAQEKGAAPETGAAPCDLWRDHAIGQRPAVFATSAATSSSSRSFPSPTTSRAMATTSTAATVVEWPAVVSGCITNFWMRMVTSLKNYGI